MPLGKQFRNTYHIDENGQEQFNTDKATTPVTKDLLKEGVAKPDDSYLAAPERSQEPKAGVPYQGMLFSPHTATGHKDDPLISHEERRAVFHKALHTGDLDEYTKNARTELGKSYTPSKGQAEKNTALINQTAFESGIPTHLAQNIDVKAVLYPKEKRGNAGHFNSNGRYIVLHKKTPVTYERTPDKEIQVSTKGAPIQNPNFNKMIQDHHFGTEWSWQHDLMGGGFERADVHLADEKGNPYSFGGEEGGHHLRELPEGHSLNVFPGSGKSTDKYIATPFRVEGKGRAGRYGYTETYKTFHTRHERIPGEGTEVIPGKTVKKLGTPNIWSDALVHEIGHSEDPHVKDVLRHRSPDPVAEATADGYEDRFNRHKDNYEEALAPSPRRAEEIKKTSYGSDRWNSKLHRALYAAVRQHVSMGDTHAQDIMSRSQAFANTGHSLPDAPGNYRKIANTDEKNTAGKMLLGHLYSTHAHVRDTLGHLGMSDIGEDAANHYRSSISDAGRNPGYEQGHLFE